MEISLYLLSTQQQLFQINWAKSEWLVQSHPGVPWLRIDLKMDLPSPTKKNLPSTLHIVKNTDPKTFPSLPCGYQLWRPSLHSQTVPSVQGMLPAACQILKCLCIHQKIVCFLLIHLWFRERTICYFIGQTESLPCSCLQKMICTFFFKKSERDGLLTLCSLLTIACRANRHAMAGCFGVIVLRDAAKEICFHMAPIVITRKLRSSPNSLWERSEEM